MILRSIKITNALTMNECLHTTKKNENEIGKHQRFLAFTEEIAKANYYANARLKTLIDVIHTAFSTFLCVG